jgi:hypothetical protein
MFTKIISPISILALSFLSATTAFAEDTIAQNTSAQSLQSEAVSQVSAFHNANRLQTASTYFDLEQRDYMRESYQDIELTLLGPIKFGVSEDIIQHRFSNIDVNYGPRVQRPDHADRFNSSTYLKATAATTSVKFKF